MEKIRWDENLSVGIDLIDEQHKTWIARLNDVSRAIESRQGPGQIGKTLGFLVDYTDVHFGTEEKYMTEHRYPGLAEHRAKHAEMKATLADLVRDFEEEGATEPLANAVNTFLGNWLANHIREVDRQFAAFLKRKGAVLPRQA